METVQFSEPGADGGFRGWIQCLGSFYLLFNTFGLTNSYGVFQSYYEMVLLKTHSPSDIAWIGSIQTFLLLALGIIAGPAFDRGHLKRLLIGGSILVVVGTICTGLCSQYWQSLLAQGIVVGSGTGLLFLPSIAILAQYFERRLAMASGIASSGGGLGSVLYAIIFNQLQPQIGFRWTTWIMALIMLVTLAISCSVLRIRQRASKVRRLIDRKAFKEPPFCLWSSHLFVCLLGLYAPSFYIQSYGLQFMAPGLAFYLLPVLNAGSFFGRIILLYTADWIGYFNVLLGSAVLASVAGFAWLSVRSVAGCFAFSSCFGFLSGSITTISAPIEVTMCPSPDVLGVRIGMFLFPWALGFLIGNPIAGSVLGTDHEWRRLQIFVGIVMTLATILGLAARLAKHGTRLRC